MSDEEKQTAPVPGPDDAAKAAAAAAEAELTKYKVFTAPSREEKVKLNTIKS